MLITLVSVNSILWLAKTRGSQASWIWSRVNLSLSSNRQLRLHESQKALTNLRGWRAKALDLLRIDSSNNPYIEYFFGVP
jgi:hypothetical protein